MSSRKYIQIFHTFFLFAFLSLFNTSFAQCTEDELKLSELRGNITQLNAESLFLEQLMLGNFEGSDVLRNKPFASFFEIPRSDESVPIPQNPNVKIKYFQEQIDTLNVPVITAEEFSLCEDFNESWQELREQHKQADIVLLSKKIEFLNQPPLTQQLLFRQIAEWEKVQGIAKEFSIIDSSVKNDKSASNQIKELRNWIDNYNQTLTSWLKLYLQSQNDIQGVEAFWLQAMTLPSPLSIASSGEPGYLAIPDFLKWQSTLNESRIVLLRDVNEWRQGAFIGQGWQNFFSQLNSPFTVIRGLLIEITWAPQSFVDNLSLTLIEEYRLASEQNQVAAFLLSFLFQLLALVTLAYVLIKIAGKTTSWLARLQQGLLSRIQSKGFITIFNGVFWILKPHSSWLFIIVAVNWLAIYTPTNWKLVGLIIPLGTIYAIFRGLRIIIESVLSRTFTSSEMFLSSEKAKQLVVDSRKIPWIGLLCIVLWWFVISSGGGYAYYLISLLNVAILWSTIVWLLTKYERSVTKFTKTVLGSKINADNPNLILPLKLIIKTSWPLIFLVAYLFDLLISLNQKMMVFDIYRAFSVKLLRARLESLSAEQKEEEETEQGYAAQKYAEWMLRDVSDEELLHIGAVEEALEPINKWYTDIVDNNVTVVVGEPGSGKTTFVKRLPLFWKKTPIKVLDVPPKLTDADVFFERLTSLLELENIDDVGGLVTQVEAKEKQIVVIDSAHHLFMAEVGCFNAYRTLMECMNANSDSIYWIVVFNAPSWTYLNYVFSREQRISNVYTMPRWTPKDIRKLILSRHKDSNRRLKYNELLLSTAVSNESTTIRAADSRVFNILWEQSVGNPQAAIELWLDAVKVNGRLVEVGVPEKPSANVLNGMKDDLYFVYSAIVLHAALSTEEIMNVTHFSEPIVRHAVKQGVNIGMIVRDETNRYKIDPYWYGSLSDFLQSKNLLWN